MQLTKNQVNYVYKKLEPKGTERNSEKMLRILRGNHPMYKIREVVQGQTNQYDMEGQVVTPEYISDPLWELKQRELKTPVHPKTNKPNY